MAAFDFGGGLRPVWGLLGRVAARRRKSARRQPSGEPARMRWGLILFGFAALLAMLTGSGSAHARAHDHAHHASPAIQAPMAQAASVQSAGVRAAASESRIGTLGAASNATEATRHDARSAHRPCADSCGLPCAAGLTACGCAALCHALVELTSVDLPAPPQAQSYACRASDRCHSAVHAPPIPPPRG